MKFSRKNQLFLPLPHKKIQTIKRNNSNSKLLNRPSMKVKYQELERGMIILFSCFIKQYVPYATCASYVFGGHV